MPQAALQGRPLKLSQASIIHNTKLEPGEQEEASGGKAGGPGGNTKVCTVEGLEGIRSSVHIPGNAHQKEDLNKCIIPNDPEVADILNTIGFGQWNIWFILIISLCQASAPTQYYNSVFTNMPTDFRCEDHYVLDNQEKIFDNSCGELEVDYVQHTYIPQNKNPNKFLSNNSDSDCLNYAYDNSLFNSTFSNEFHLFCNKAWLSQLFQLIFVLGSIHGNLFTGLSDKYGRAIVIKVSSYFYLLGVLVVGFGHNAYIVLAGRFIIGFCYPILNGSAYSLMMETTTTQYRSTVGMLVFLPYELFTILLGLLAYYVREWRVLYLLISLPIYPLPLVAMFVSESPRWLIQKGYFEEAYFVLKDASIKNGSTLPAKNIVLRAMQGVKTNVSYEKSQSHIKLTLERTGLLKTLFASAKMRKISIVTPLLWFLVSIVYFAVPLNANSFTTNPFMYMVMMGCVQMSVPVFGHFVIKRFGNIRTCQVSLFIAGVCMLTIVAIPKYIIWPKYILVSIAIILVALICAICFIITNELFPTVVRSAALGICLTAYYFGFFFGSFINNFLVDDISWSFNVVCGLCSIVSGILAMLLPETQGKSLCETVDDVNNRAQN